MKKEWTSAGKYGLRYREHESKTTGAGRTKRPLRYYTSVYKWKEKTITDVFGWEGEDFKNEDDIVAVALELKQNRRNLTPPFTLKEKLAARESALAEIEKAKAQNEARLALEERTKVVNVFDEYIEANAHKKSLKDEINYFKNWIGPAIGNKKLNEVVLLDLERIRKKMAATGKAPRTIQYIKSIIRQVYNYASDHGLYSGESPTVKFLKKERYDNKRKRYLSPDEAERLLDEVRKYSEKTYQICLLSLNSGMRFGEMASLRWQHIDIEKQEILVVDPKNGETRSVFMTDRVLEMFRTITKGRPDELVFPSGTGDKRTRVSKVFAKAVDDLGLNEGISDDRLKVVFHTLRHSCASILVNADVPITVIAKVLGHKTLAMTMRYSHVNDRSVKNAMAVLNDKQQSKEKVVSIGTKRRKTS